MVPLEANSFSFGRSSRIALNLAITANSAAPMAESRRLIGDDRGGSCAGGGLGSGVRPSGVSMAGGSHCVFASIPIDCRNGHIASGGVANLGSYSDHFSPHPQEPRGEDDSPPSSPACTTMSAGGPCPAAILGYTSPGTTGFDVVGSWGWLRVEVPGGLVKHPGKNKCEAQGFFHARIRPRCLTSS